MTAEMMVGELAIELPKGEVKKRDEEEKKSREESDRRQTFKP